MSIASRAGVVVRDREPGDRGWAEELIGHGRGEARQARLGELVDPFDHPGLVAEVVTTGPGPAVVVRAFGGVGRAAVRGVLLRIGPRGLLVRRASGRSVRIAINARTTVWHGATRLGLRALRPGMRVDVYRAAGGVARVIVIRSAAA